MSQSKIDGLGVLTRVLVPEGTTVITWGGVVFSHEQVKAGLARNHTIVGIGEGQYLGNLADQPQGVDDYMNHSCNPNIWMVDEVTLSARRNIEVGEELVADYAIWLPDESYVMKKPCNCGSTNCRTRITGKDWRLKALQDAYRGHFSPFLNERIRSLTN